jgi:hypothetical protein
MRVFGASFGLAVVAGLAADHWAYSHRAPTPAQRAITAGLPDAWFDFRVPTPPDAKARHSLWLYRPRQHRTGVALSDEGRHALQSELFPGYPESMADDAALWSRWFSEPADENVWVPRLQGPTQIIAQGSLLGSTDVFRSYGADVVVFGNSKVFFGVVPSELSDQLAPRFGHVVRTLVVARGAAFPEMVLGAATRMAGSGQRAKAAVLGYDYAWALMHHPLRVAQHREARALFAGRGSDASLAALLPTMDWGAIAPLTLPEALRQVSPPTSPGAQPEPQEIQLRPLPGEPVFQVPADVAADETQLQTEARRFAEAKPPVLSAEAVDCDMTAASQELDTLIARLGEVADQVFIYVPPTADPEVAAAPSCYWPALTAMLRSKAGPQVFVQTESWREYGLSWRDYTTPDADPRRVWVDVPHANYRGARRATERLGRWMSSESREASR